MNMYINVHVCTCVILINISFLQYGDETASSSPPELRFVRRIPAKWSLIEAQNRAALYVESRELGVRQETSLMFDEPQVYIAFII